MHHNSSDNAVDYHDAGSLILGPAVSTQVDDCCSSTLPLFALSASADERDGPAVSTEGDDSGGLMLSWLAVPAEAGDRDGPHSQRSGQQRSNFQCPCFVYTNFVLKSTASVALRANGKGMDLIYTEQHDKITWDRSFTAGSYDYINECPVATNTKGAKQHDAEQEQYEGQLMILYKLVDTSCL